MNPAIRVQVPAGPAFCKMLSSRLRLYGWIIYISIVRSYLAESTGSHPNSEVKQLWACTVLRWGTTRESQVTHVFGSLCVALFHRIETSVYTRSGLDSRDRTQRRNQTKQLSRGRKSGRVLKSSGQMDVAAGSYRPQEACKV